jgi:chorismate-pyruvate lyase
VNGEVESVCQVMKLGPGDRILGVSPFFHSYGIITGFLCPILSGAQTYTINDFFPKDVAALIKRERITGFPGVPFMYQQLADLSKDADLSSLRYAISAGAPLPPETAATFRSRFGLPIRQHYGTTETGSVSVEPDDPSEQQEMSVGLPFPGVRIQIVDESSHPIEPGEIGNVAISSAFAASEYESPSAPGDSAFRDNLFLPGDLGRINLLGRLVLCGRRRGFINVAGNKVDPAEVEAVLKQIPAVTEAVVLGLPDGAAGEKIKAALVTAEPCSRNEVYAHCSAALADFKRPRIIEFRKELPRSPLGKILRKYLLDEQADEPRYVFDPRTGFRQATIALSEDPVSSSLATLSPVLRSLLVTDGTITKILEAFFWEPIDIDILKHTEDAAEIDDVEFGIRAGDSILRRRVILRGRFTASSYVFAETVIASEAFSPDFRRLLLEGRKGIGELLRDQQLETYRELVGVERAEAGLWAGYLGIESTAPVAVRQYSIRHNGRSAVKILEVFPEHRFIDFR